MEKETRKLLDLLDSRFTNKITLLEENAIKELSGIIELKDSINSLQKQLETIVEKSLNNEEKFFPTRGTLVSKIPIPKSSLRYQEARGNNTVRSCSINERNNTVASRNSSVNQNTSNNFQNDDAACNALDALIYDHLFDYVEKKTKLPCEDPNNGMTKIRFKDIDLTQNNSKNDEEVSKQTAKKISIIDNSLLLKHTISSKNKMRTTSHEKCLVHSLKDTTNTTNTTNNSKEVINTKKIVKNNINNKRLTVAPNRDIGNAKNIDFDYSKAYRDLRKSLMNGENNINRTSIKLKEEHEENINNYANNKNQKLKGVSPYLPPSNHRKTKSQHTETNPISQNDQLTAETDEYIRNNNNLLKSYDAHNKPKNILGNTNNVLFKSYNGTKNSISFVNANSNFDNQIDKKELSKLQTKTISNINIVKANNNCKNRRISVPEKTHNFIEGINKKMISEAKVSIYQKNIISNNKEKKLIGGKNSAQYGDEKAEIKEKSISINLEREVNFLDIRGNIPAKTNFSVNLYKTDSKISQRKKKFFSYKNYKIIENILSFFTEKEIKISLKNISKCFMTYSSRLNIKSLNMKRIDIENKLQHFKSKYKEEDYTREPAPLLVSRGTQKAIELLNDPINQKFYENKIVNNPEIILIYKIYSMLLNKEEIYRITDNNLFFVKLCDYFIKNGNGKLGDFILSKVSEFDFSAENLYKIIKTYEKDLNKINPTYYSKICSTTSLFIFLLKDALEYCGVLVVEKKSQLQKVFNNYTYFLDNIEIKISKLEDFICKLLK